MTSRSSLRLLLAAAALFILAMALRLPLVDRYYRCSFEPDAGCLLRMTDAYCRFWSSFRLGDFPRYLSPSPTYLDGSFIVDGAAAAVVAALQRAGIAWCDIPGGHVGVLVFVSRWTSLLFGGLTTIVVFLALVELSGRLAPSFVLALFAYACNTQLAGVDLIRIDNYLLFWVVLTLYLCLRVLREPSSLLLHGLLGAASAFALATKINAPLHLMGLPLVYGYLVMRGLVHRRRICVALAVFAAVSVCLFARWLICWPDIVPTVKAIIAEGAGWIEMWNHPNGFYFNVDQFYFARDYDWHGATTWFSTPAYYLGLVAVAACVAVVAVRHEDRPRNALILCMALTHTVYGYYTPKLDRYGILFPVFYVLLVGCALRPIVAGRSTRVVIAASAALLVPVLPYFDFQYRFIVFRGAYLSGLVPSIARTREAPRAWLESNVAPGSRVCYFAPHRWASPPVFDLDFDFGSPILAFPYLSASDVLAFLPPTRSGLVASVDVMLLQNLHYDSQLEDILQYGKGTTGFFDDRFWTSFPDLESIVRTEVVDRMWSTDVTFRQAVSDVVPARCPDGSADRLLQFVEQNYDGMADLAFEPFFRRCGGASAHVAWTSFYRGLGEFPLVEFHADSLNYGIKWVKIFIVNPTCRLQPAHRS